MSAFKRILESSTVVEVRTSDKEEPRIAGGNMVPNLRRNNENNGRSNRMLKTSAVSSLDFQACPILPLLPIGELLKTTSRCISWTRDHETLLRSCTQSSAAKFPHNRLLHGWPDLWFGWRFVIKGLSGKYRYPI